MRRGRGFKKGPRPQEQASFLAQKRIAHGMTQDDLSRKVGIDRSYLSRIEHKDRPLHTLPWDLVISLAEAIECDPQDLVMSMK